MASSRSKGRTAKKSAAKKSAAKKSAAKKSAAKKSAAKKSAAKKSATKKSAAKKSAAKRQASRTAKQQRALQRSMERRRPAAKKRAARGGKPVQPADQQQPVRFQAKSLRKPGREADLSPRPEYEAPTYVGSSKLNNRVALITGGDSGIGRAVAVLFAREGADIAIVYLTEHDDADETCRAVEAEGRRCIAIPGDVRDSAFCDAAVDQTVEAFGRLDILVNNAAYQERQYALEEITDEQLDMTFRTNIYAYFYMARAALAHLGEGGVILNSGSVTGLEGEGSLLDYSATKGAIHAFTKSLAQNLVDRGIRVNAVAPGPVWTPLNPADLPADEVPEFGASVPMGRAAQPEELAPTYVFLAAPSMSSYITGEVVGVLGG